ncbi:RNA polymerase sigma factor [Sphingobium ummariense]
MTDGNTEPTEDDKRRFAEALETLPLLTRTVFMLARRDDLPYPEIAWRCGISEPEVQVRFADALLKIMRHMDGRRTLLGFICRELLPWRDAWAAARAREGDRRLARWFPPERRPGKRGFVDWMAWAFERLAR